MQRTVGFSILKQIFGLVCVCVRACACVCVCVCVCGGVRLALIGNQLCATDAGTLAIALITVGFHILSLRYRIHKE